MVLLWCFGCDLGKFSCDKNDLASHSLFKDMNKAGEIIAH